MNQGEKPLHAARQNSLTAQMPLLTQQFCSASECSCDGADSKQLLQGNEQMQFQEHCYSLDPAAFALYQTAGKEALHNDMHGSLKVLRDRPWSAATSCGQDSKLSIHSALQSSCGHSQLQHCTEDESDTPSQCCSEVDAAAHLQHDADDGHSSYLAAIHTQCHTANTRSALSSCASETSLRADLDADSNAELEGVEGAQEPKGSSTMGCVTHMNAWNVRPSSRDRKSQDYSGRQRPNVQLTH